MVARARGSFISIIPILEEANTVHGAFPVSDRSLDPIIFARTLNIDKDYLYELFRDPTFFGTAAGQVSRIQYWSNGQFYILACAGADSVYDIDSLELFSEGANAETDLRTLAHVAYDPTNGVKSRGDIIVFSGDDAFSIKSMNRYLLK
jgi:hypothetical protein